MSRLTVCFSHFFQQAFLKTLQAKIAMEKMIHMTPT